MNRGLGKFTHARDDLFEPVSELHSLSTQHHNKPDLALSDIYSSMIEELLGFLSGMRFPDSDGFGGGSDSVGFKWIPGGVHSGNESTATSRNQPCREDKCNHSPLVTVFHAIRAAAGVAARVVR